MPGCDKITRLFIVIPLPKFLYPRLSASWMKFQERIGQIVAIQMRVNLRSGNALMPQHFLNRS